MRAHSANRIFLVLTAALGGAAAAAVAQDATPPQRPKCDAAEHRQFDFWVGEWEVKNPAGNVVGHNTIRLTLKDCVLHESWAGGGGGKGESFNIYSRADGRWYQTWVDDSGNILRLSGGLEGKRMVLSGEGKGQGGADVIHEIAWTPLEDGRVEQHWRSSSDGGTSWSDVFKGLYSKQAP